MKLDLEDMESKQTLVNTYVALSITTSSPLPGASNNTYYNEDLAVTGGNEKYSWSVDSGNLPPGIQLTESGSLHGTPTSTGTYTFTAKVVDAVGKEDTKSLELTVS